VTAGPKPPRRGPLGDEKPPNTRTNQDAPGRRAAPPGPPPEGPISDRQPEGGPRNLADFMDDNIGMSRGDRLVASGPATRILARQVGDNAVAESLIAGCFWWTYSRTSDYRQTVIRLGIPAQSLRRLLVSHAGGTRTNLLLLSPDHRAIPQAVRIRPDPAALRAAATTAGQNSARTLRDRLADWDVVVDNATLSAAMDEVASRHSFSVVAAELPQEELTAAPTPAIPVQVGEHAVKATIGVLIADGRGGYRATTALHALVDDPQNVRVGRGKCSLISSDVVTDSCLLRLTRSPNGVRFFGAGGLLCRSMPTQYSHAEFDGARSGRKRTMILGADLEYLDPSPHLATKVQTGPDTLPGDSGSALIDGNDRIVGFASSRSSLGSGYAFASWVCAEQVLRRLRMT